MAGPTVPHICDFNDEQRRTFQSLEDEFRNKWNITLRWDSQVPKKDRCFYYFFTVRSLDRDQIIDDMSEFERVFGEIHDEMQEVRRGEALSQEHIRRLRERFEDVLQTVRETINSTESSTVYRAASGVLGRSEKVLRYFDNAEIVQSRRELRERSTEMDDLRIDYEDQQRMMRTLSNSLDGSRAEEEVQERTIERLRRQLAESQESYLISNDMINLVQRNQLTSQSQNLKELNTTNDKLKALIKILEDYKICERKRDEKIQNLEAQLRVSSERVLREIHELGQLMNRILSSAGGNKKEEKSKRRQDIPKKNGLMTNLFSNTLDVSEALERTCDERMKCTEDLVRDITERNQETRAEWKNLMLLLDQTLSFPDVRNQEGYSEVIGYLLKAVTHMSRKLNALSSSFEDSITREVRREDKIENLEKQIRVTSEEILGEIHKLTQLMNEKF